MGFYVLQIWITFPILKVSAWSGPTKGYFHRITEIQAASKAIIENGYISDPTGWSGVIKGPKTDKK